LTRIVDCEGYAVDFFSDNVVTSLKKCDPIVELHEVPETDVRSILLERIKRSHSAKLISSDPRNVGPGVPDCLSSANMRVRPESGGVERWKVIAMLE
jgi:hypothetical protein